MVLKKIKRQVIPEFKDRVIIQTLHFVPTEPNYGLCGIPDDRAGYLFEDDPGTVWYQVNGAWCIGSRIGNHILLKDDKSYGWIRKEDRKEK